MRVSALLGRVNILRGLNFDRRSLMAGDYARNKGSRLAAAFAYLRVATGTCPDVPGRYKVR